jgi:hypothetical protein
LLEKAAYAIHYLIENGCAPYVYYHSGTRQVENKAGEVKKEETQSEGNGKDNPAWCPIHLLTRRAQRY